MGWVEQHFNLPSLLKFVLDIPDYYEIGEEGAVDLVSEFLDRDMYARLVFYGFVGHFRGNAACDMLASWK